MPPKGYKSRKEKEQQETIEALLEHKKLVFKLRLLEIERMQANAFRGYCGGVAICSN